MATWKEKLKNDPVPWLLESNPWTKYRTLVNLLELPDSSAEVQRAKEELFQDPQIRGLIKDTSGWFPQSITRHNDAKISHYKLMMLAEFGLDMQDQEIQNLVKLVMNRREEEMFAARQTLPQKGKGFEKPDPNANEWHAIPCDSPLILYSLMLLGVKSPQIVRAVEILKEKWKTEQGWFCHFFFVESQFKKLNIGCPMAGLMALQVFSLFPDLKESQYARNAFAPTAFHKDYGKTLYYFGRSKKFWAFKYPFVWYNALYLADVLTRFEFLHGHALVKELVAWIEESQDENGRFKPTSMFRAYKGWDFSNKKEPSPWMTFLCCRILKRWYG
jgi:hypothetical protein